MERGRILAIQSFGYLDGKDDHSPEAMVSRARISHAARLVGKGEIPRDNLVLIFPQGYSKASPTEMIDLRPSLASQMAKECLEYEVFKNIKIVYEARGWGTRFDVANTLEMAREQGFRHGTIYFVTDPSHMPRVKQVWKHLHSVDWSPRFLALPQPIMPWKDRAKEPFKRFGYWWLLR